VLFWVKLATIYLLVALGGFALAVAVSFLSVLPLASDDSPFLGFIWGIIFLLEAAVLIPLSLALVAECVERKSQGRKFSWPRALARFGMALIIGVGPLYTCFYVLGTIESFLPHYYAAKQAILYCLSGIFAFLALRIRRGSESH
jgi:hypothetical protein